MIDVSLPGDLRAATEQVVEEAGFAAGGDATVRLSEAYRARRPSSTAVTGDDDVSAYLLTRLPATYAAIASVLSEITARSGFSPYSLLDAGCGPGTASWAAAEQFAGLRDVVWLDQNRFLLEMARRLAAQSGRQALAGALAVRGSMAAPPLEDRRFDLVVAGYALTELGDAEMVPAALELWERCDGVLAIIEPGRPRDYARLMAVRAALIGRGARVIAPCPHENACPLLGEDWCHFGVRLPRSRAHRQAKGAELGYEDEKFSYLTVARSSVVIRPAQARVLRPPVRRKFEVELALCAAEGLEERHILKRDALFKPASKLGWGAAIG